MLQERITVGEAGFQIRKKNADPKREAKYVTFSLKDGKINKDHEQRVEYWSPVNGDYQIVDTNSFLYIWEEKDGEEVDSYSLYIGSGNPKPQIQYSITEDTHYGKNAYMIKIKWISNVREAINSKHIWLKNQQNGRKYSFLTECLTPDEKGEDRYIINIAPGIAELMDLMIEGDELLQQKYLIVK